MQHIYISYVSIGWRKHVDVIISVVVCLFFFLHQNTSCSTHWNHSQKIIKVSFDCPFYLQQQQAPRRGIVQYRGLGNALFFSQILIFKNCILWVHTTSTYIEYPQPCT